MDIPRQTLAGLILGGVGLLFVFLGGAPVSVALSIAGIILTVQGWQSGGGKLWCMLSFGLNGLCLVLGLLFSLIGGLFHWIF